MGDLEFLLINSTCQKKLTRWLRGIARHGQLLGVAPYLGHDFPIAFHALGKTIDVVAATLLERMAMKKVQRHAFGVSNAFTPGRGHPPLETPRSDPAQPAEGLCKQPGSGTPSGRMNRRTTILTNAAGPCRPGSGPSGCLTLFNPVCRN